MVTLWLRRFMEQMSVCRETNNDGRALNVSDSIAWMEIKNVKAAKYAWLTETPPSSTTNPWIACLRAHAVVCDQPAMLDYTHQQKEEARDCLQIAFDAGWTVSDAMQAIEWTRHYFPNTPTIAQWASLLDISQSEIQRIQQTLTIYLVDAWSLQERATWDLALGMNLSFDSWTFFAHQQLDAIPSVSLPDGSLSL